MTDSANLHAARLAVIDMLARKADAVAVEQKQIARIKSEEARLIEMRRQHSGLELQIASAKHELETAEEVALANYCVTLAGQIIQRHAADPVCSNNRTLADIERLRSATRSAIDTPRGERYRVHALVQQALLLAPAPDDLHRSVAELGAAHSTPWAERRRELCESIYPPILRMKTRASA
jgi:hypothetical protein